jgi:hypothetical protein
MVDMTTQTRVSQGVPTGGEFAAHKRADSSVTLSETPAATGWPTSEERTGYELIDDAASRCPLDLRYPKGLTETRAALRNTRGEPNKGVRIVQLTWASVPAASDAGDIEVHGPKDGRPIIIYIIGGFPRIKVKSGYAMIVANSGAGHSIEVQDGATALVVATKGRKVSTRTEAGAVLDFTGSEGGWGSQTAEFGGLLTTHGDTSDYSIGRRDENGQMHYEKKAGI